MEEDELRDSDAVEKVRETGDSDIIIGEIMCLFLLQKLPILLAPLYFSPLHVRDTHKSSKKVKARHQVWDCTPQQQK